MIPPRATARYVRPQPRAVPGRIAAAWAPPWHDDPSPPHRSAGRPPARGGLSMVQPPGWQPPGCWRASRLRGLGGPAAATPRRTPAPGRPAPRPGPRTGVRPRLRRRPSGLDAAARARRRAAAPARPRRPAGRRGPHHAAQPAGDVRAVRAGDGPRRGAVSTCCCWRAAAGARASTRPGHARPLEVAGLVGAGLVSFVVPACSVAGDVRAQRHADQRGQRRGHRAPSDHRRGAPPRRAGPAPAGWCSLTLATAAARAARRWRARRPGRRCSSCVAVPGRGGASPSPVPCSRSPVVFLYVRLAFAAPALLLERLGVRRRAAPLVAAGHRLLVAGARRAAAHRGHRGGDLGSAPGAVRDRRRRWWASRWGRPGDGSVTGRGWSWPSIVSNLGVGAGGGGGLPVHRGRRVAALHRPADPPRGPGRRPGPRRRGQREPSAASRPGTDPPGTDPPGFDR